MPQPVIGCDLSRAFLDLYDLPSGRTQRIPSTRAAAVIEWTQTLTPDVLVVFEATSGCDDSFVSSTPITTRTLNHFTALGIPFTHPVA